MKFRNALTAGILAALLSVGAGACNDDGGGIEDPLNGDTGTDIDAGDDPLLDS
ncbi:MAG TPA: hypothetical protein VM287_11305 [Egibacteraceae bacterium]|nr:hypothetical protein [Egibacteraceae bacterium]